MIYDILMVVLAILIFPASIFLFIKYKAVSESYIKFFLMLAILKLFGEVYPDRLDFWQNQLFMLFFMLMIGWIFYSIISESKMFKDYQKKQVEK